MYKALFLKIFLRQEKKLDKEVKDRVTKAVKETIGNPLWRYTINRGFKELLEKEGRKI